MNDIDPYKSPEVVEETHFKLNSIAGYCDGGDFIASKDFIAPKVCVVTGQSAEEKLVPVKVSMDSQSEFLTVLIVRWALALLGFGIIFCFFLYTIDGPLMPMIFITGYMLWVSLSDLIVRSITPSITVFCTTNIKKKLRLKKFICIVCLFTGFMLILNTDDNKDHLWRTISGLVLIVVYSSFKEKTLLKSISRACCLIEADTEKNLVLPRIAPVAS